MIRKLKHLKRNIKATKYVNIKTRKNINIKTENMYHSKLSNKIGTKLIIGKNSRLFFFFLSLLNNKKLKYRI